MNLIKLKTPAKINLLLEIMGKRNDGFHEIKSIMQAVNLFDIITIELEKTDNDRNIILIEGDSPDIPYDESNIAFKSAEIFLEELNTDGNIIKIHIEKNIPVSAGLAGGSSNASGVLIGLNELFGSPFDYEKIHNLALKLGSDLNFCIVGGNCECSSRGEIIKPLNFVELNFVVIKPKNISVSAREAYLNFSRLEKKPELKNFEKMKNAVLNKAYREIPLYLNNHLENAVIPFYPEIQQIKNYLISKNCYNALMSGSGPSAFGIYQNEPDFDDIPQNWQIFKLKSFDKGVTIL